MAKETDLEGRKDVLAFDGEVRRASTMKTWGLSQAPVNPGESEYATIPVSDTTRFEEADMRRSRHEHMALVAPVALGPLGAMIADSIISFGRAVE